ncbi:acetyl-CoA carboxylase [Paenibacillus swuensis]|uniref:Biotin carboxyl carrier protein of acetyl-CoA carboxylase n=1 Tax=Paenibacillus swuensis TaxID=1178515 RepID=A0A172TM61_9BACL|nr:acetyl-CoA carboxylase biotin carboxyl carrier protein [Paenibacillus swuensis]ANE48072.1 acetyl-CoA carboxylase [Paenibacillus swuensis]
MFKLSEIKDLIKLIDQTSIQEFEIENEGTRILIKKPNPAESYVLQTSAAPGYYSQAPLQMNAPQVQATVPASADSATVQVQSTEETELPNLHKIVSPMVGTFYASPGPGSSSYVQTGDKVKDKTVVCIVEAMKLMNEIEAEVHGEIVEVLVENGQLVEFGQPLFLVKPE